MGDYGEFVHHLTAFIDLLIFKLMVQVMMAMITLILMLMMVMLMLTVIRKMKIFASLTQYSWYNTKSPVYCGAWYSALQHSLM